MYTSHERGEHENKKSFTAEFKREAMNLVELSRKSLP